MGLSARSLSARAKSRSSSLGWSRRTSALSLASRSAKQLGDRLAGDRGRLRQRPALVADAVDAAVLAVAAGVAQVVLHVADDRVVPVQEVDRPVRPHADVGGPEVRVAGRHDRLLLDADEARVLVLDLVAEDALEA